MDTAPSETAASDALTPARAAAEQLLQEAVYTSRAKQAGAAGLAGADLEGSAGPGGCGLGLRALVDLGRSPAARAAFETLFPAPLGAADESALEAVLTRWVERQDALDRKRNHFMRDFREQHGYDRRQYDDAQRAAHAAGLDAVNAEENAGRREHAQAVLDLRPSPPPT